MDYPGADDYVIAVQQPSRAFADPDLRQAEFQVHPLLGVPMPAAGSTAVVFKARVAGGDQALRFFLRDDASSRDRYVSLGRYLRDTGLVANAATAEWSDHGIRIGEQWYPMIRMQWVDGRTLDQYVDHLVQAHDVRSLGALAETWRALVGRMQGARFAHGDLQHGNVLIDDRGALRLVDFDCSWIEPFTGLAAPTETGHRNYQRPDNHWGPWMDTFPSLVIYLSLLALSRNTHPWAALNNEDNLIFRREDFDPPFATPVWGHLAALKDPLVDRVAGRLRECCSASSVPAADLETVLSGMDQIVITKHDWWLKTQARREPGTGGASTAPTGAPAPGPDSGRLPPPPPKPGPSRTERPSSPPHRDPVRGPWTPRPGAGPWWAAPGPGQQPTPPTPLDQQPGWGKLVALCVMIAAVAGLVAAVTAALYDINEVAAVAAFLISFVLVGGCGLAIGAANRRPPPGPPR